MAIVKLSDAGLLRVLTLNETTLNNYVFTNKRIEIDTKGKYDIAIVFSCTVYDVMFKRADAAIALYKDGIVKKLLLTGGVGYLSTHRKESEANVMKKYMIASGINSNDIIIEDKSRNTYENVKNSLKIINNIPNIKKVIIVTSDFHLKRCKAMLKKMSNLQLYNYGIPDGIYDIDKWNHCNFSTRKMIITEGMLLSWYVRKKKIDDQLIVIIDSKSRYK